MTNQEIIPTFVLPFLMLVLCVFGLRTSRCMTKPEFIPTFVLSFLMLVLCVFGLQSFLQLLSFLIW